MPSVEDTRNSPHNLQFNLMSIHAIFSNKMARIDIKKQKQWDFKNKSPISF